MKTLHTLTVGIQSCVITQRQSVQECMECIDLSAFIVVDAAVFNNGIIDLKGYDYLIVPGGEVNKTSFIFDSILKACFRKTLARDSSIVAIGGGALCDVVSFVASVYLRGIQCVLIPTTLLSMVDASIGGKTATNYNGLKNMVGTFYLANSIIICEEFLTTLSWHELRCGLIEALKAGMLKNKHLVAFIEQAISDIKNPYAENNSNVWEKIIQDAIAVKVDIVHADFMESGERAILNLGHTFAHALEATNNYLYKNHSKKNEKYWTHGEAVALGIRTALLLGVELGYTNINYAERIISILDSLECPSHYNGISVDRLCCYMQNDKKRKEKEVEFVIQKDIETTFLRTVPIESIKKVLIGLGGK